jgi:lambda repressor-like predicted transcriptional regulator
MKNSFSFVAETITTMSSTTYLQMDVRDEIKEYLKSQERSLHWLSKKAGINYNSLYSIMVHKTYDLSPENKAKINEVLGTKF